MLSIDRGRYFFKVYDPQSLPKAGVSYHVMKERGKFYTEEDCNCECEVKDSARSDRFSHSVNLSPNTRAASVYVFIGKIKEGEPIP